jgi:ATP-binding cassette subfamily B protein
MERINVILNTPPEIIDDEKTKDINEIVGDIQIKDLTFAYDDKGEPALKNINLNIEAGSILAVVGRTGSGKSTLMNLLTRNYDPDPGSIFIDNTDIRQIPLQTLRQNIGYIPQETFLFSDSIAQNVSFGLGTAQEDQVQRATEISQIHEAIEEFPDKYKTILGERGINLSGGQKQRISIARAVLKQPKILLLDDALSAVDTITEEKILEKLRGEMQNKTCVWISHRISALQDADKIVVLDQGEIIEEGTHAELLRLDGLYRDLYEKQKLEEALDLVE